LSAAERRIARAATRSAQERPAPAGGYASSCQVPHGRPWYPGAAARGMWLPGAGARRPATPEGLTIAHAYARTSNIGHGPYCSQPLWITRELECAAVYRLRAHIFFSPLFSPPLFLTFYYQNPPLSLSPFKRGEKKDTVYTQAIFYDGEGACRLVIRPGVMSAMHQHRCAQYSL
jgi:hypothetical protein